MPVEFTPPRIAVVIDKSTYTRELILASGTLALNLPCRTLADLSYTVGSVSGREHAGQTTTSSAATASTASSGPALGLPLVEGCVAWLECRHLDEPRSEERYDTFFCEVVSAQADARVFAKGRWSFRSDNAELHTLHHLGAGLFAVPAQTVQGTLLPPR